MKHSSLALVGRALAVSLALAMSGPAFAAAPAEGASKENEAEPRMVREAVAVARQLRHSDNAFDQIAAAGTLVDVGDKEALQFLSDTMDHTDWALMRSAIDMLLNVQHPAGVDLIYRAAQRNRDGVFVKFLSESLATRPREDMAEFHGRDGRRRHLGEEARAAGARHPAVHRQGGAHASHRRR
jgi:HEAT repeat protein